MQQKVEELFYYFVQPIFKAYVRYAIDTRKQSQNTNFITVERFFIR
jgi:hypothetical protein